MSKKTNIVKILKFLLFIFYFMERADNSVPRLDTVGSGGSGPRITESRPAVESFIRAAIAGTANDLVQNPDGESDVGPLEDPGAYEQAYDNLYAEAHPYPKVGEPVIVDDALMATWVGEEWDDGTSQQITPMDTGDTDSW